VFVRLRKKIRRLNNPLNCCPFMPENSRRPRHQGRVPAGVISTRLRNFFGIYPARLFRNSFSIVPEIFSAFDRFWKTFLERFDPEIFSDLTNFFHVRSILKILPNDRTGFSTFDDPDKQWASMN